MVTEGVSRLESTTQLGLLWNAALGVVSGVAALVVQFVPRAQVPPGGQLFAPGVKEVTQPGGRAGAVTPSKFWLKRIELHGVGLGVTVGVPVGVGVAVGGTGSTLSMSVAVVVPCAFDARKVMGNTPPVVG